MWCSSGRSSGAAGPLQPLEVLLSMWRRWGLGRSVCLEIQIGACVQASTLQHLCGQNVLMPLCGSVLHLSLGHGVYLQSPVARVLMWSRGITRVGRSVECLHVTGGAGLNLGKQWLLGEHCRGREGDCSLCLPAQKSGALNGADRL